MTRMKCVERAAAILSMSRSMIKEGNEEEISLNGQPQKGVLRARARTHH